MKINTRNQACLGSDSQPPKMTSHFQGRWANVFFASDWDRSAEKKPDSPDTFELQRPEKKGCANQKKIKRLSLNGSILLSLMSLLGGIGYFCHQVHQQYGNQPTFQTRLEIKKSLGKNQDTIPAFSDRYHTSMVFKNQLMAHLNSVALYNPNALSAQPLPKDQLALIHDIDHLQYTQADQRAIGKIAAKLEAVALEIDQAKRSVDDLNSVLAETYKTYADTVLTQHLKPEKVALYQTLANHSLESVQNADQLALRVYGFLFGNLALTGVLLKLAKRRD